MNFELILIKVPFIKGDKGADNQTPAIDRKTIKLFLDDTEDDSEKLPVLMTVENMKDFIKNLQDLVNISDDSKPVFLILDNQRILDTHLISNESSYNLSLKVKPNVIKMYLVSVSSS